MSIWIKAGLVFIFAFSLIVNACSQTKKTENTENTSAQEEIEIAAYLKDTTEAEKIEDSAVVVVPNKVDSSETKRIKLISEAEKLIGVRYCPASNSPQSGFDCSGFVWYVFNKIGMEVPRSSSAFANVGREVKLEDAKPGDVIVFTGTTNYNKSQPGHVGIVYKKGSPLQFIHSTSGKAYGVTITPFEKNYVKRFIKIVRVIN